jgi:hypothetical protein
LYILLNVHGASPSNGDLVEWFIVVEVLLYFLSGRELAIEGEVEASDLGFVIHYPLFQGH